MPSRFDRFDTDRIRPVPVGELNHKVRLEQFGRPAPVGGTADDLLRSMPSLLAARNLNEAIDAVVEAKRKGAPVLLLFGAHVVKCGLAPCLIPLIRNGIVTGLATNGAGVIHDYEIARFGSTSENVPENLDAGRFGMGRETAEGINRIIREGLADDLGIGESLGRALTGEEAPHRDVSFLAAAYESGIPFTVHVAIGTDIIHMHPSVSGEETGRATMLDFRTFVAGVEKLQDESVVLHVGSAVILPEVFLKAVSMVRNAGGRPVDFLAVNFDMIRAYRPAQNVIGRPCGRGIDLTGHHEIMLPLLAAGIHERLNI